ncbi:MAG: hypothetical protein AB1656_25385 [Candidatus Omnitrophota bacterium]
MKRVVGVKANYQLEAGDSFHSPDKSQRIEPYVVLIVSPINKRIGLFLRDLFLKARKFLRCDGVDLYRKALRYLSFEPSRRVVALIITDRPEDHQSLSENKIPLWKETILGYRQIYLEANAEEIKNDVFPADLTVITLFKHKNGKMKDSEIEALEREFLQLQEEIQFNRLHCESEEELLSAVNDSVIGSVVTKFKQSENLRKYERKRSQKLAKARKITKDAYLKQLRGE